MKTRIAAVQMVSGPDIAQNLREAGRLVAEAADRGARLVALPEYFPLISGSETDKVRAREKDGEGPLQDFLRETAARCKVWLVGGSIPLEASLPDKVRNSCLVYADDGRRVARYDKIHLFGFTRGTERYNESQTIEPGGEVVAFDSPVGRVGLSICYDLRFPELYRAMGPVDLLVVPAAFTHTTGQAHWELLLRARAVENLCYVLAAAQGGTHPSGRRTWGDSMLVDPWGEVLDRLPAGPGVVTAELDPARIAEVRASLPALQHRVL
ncbi:MAG: carbon-nitrogen hydrolase family protein [Rhodocyclaceae bacterium]|jgi:nitrilase|nr:Deaminated glutathione amidase [Rhodocyclaceae bacterium]MCC6878337.1 carbon-nitrogen hydrolase family protein [Rhodocyclaceae bacterium]